MTAVQLDIEVAGDALEVFDGFTAAMLTRWRDVGSSRTQAGR